MWNWLSMFSYANWEQLSWLFLCIFPLVCFATYFHFKFIPLEEAYGGKDKMDSIESISTTSLLHRKKKTKIKIYSFSNSYWEFPMCGSFSLFFLRGLEFISELNTNLSPFRLALPFYIKCILNNISLSNLLLYTS